MRTVYPIILATAFLGSGCASSPESQESGATAARQTAEVNTSLGREYLSRGQYEIALEKLRKAVNSDPDYAPAHTMLAVLYERIREPELAERHYRNAVDVNPDGGDVNNNYGVFLCQSGREASAEEYFMKAVDDPFYRTPEVAYANAGACQLRRENLDKAERYLRQSLEYDAEFPDALLPMASINLRKGDFLRARAFLQRYEAGSPDSAESLLLGHRIESQLKDARAAQQYVDRLRQQFPDSRQVRELQGNKE